MISKYELYGGDIILEFENGNKHIYRVDGEIVPGVTTVTGVLDKPALKQWAANMTIEHVRNNIRPGCVYDEIDLEQILNDARFSFRKKADKAADIGSLVHNWIERYIKKENPEMPINEQARNGVNAFLEFVNTNKITFIFSEKKIYSKKYKYAGTLDFVANINGDMCIGDIKTSSGIYDEMFYQVSAYQQALTEENVLEYPITKQLIVNCKKDGTLDIKYSMDFKKDIKVFVACLEIYNRQQEVKNAEKRQTGPTKRTYTPTAQEATVGA